ncbi:ABC transporter permease [Bacillus sp. FSL W7-1360]
MSQFNNGKAFYQLFLMNLRELMRDPLTFFMALAFPFLFVLIFGLTSTITGQSNQLNYTIGIMMPDQSTSSMKHIEDGLGNLEGIKTKRVEVGQEKQAIEDEEVSSVVDLSFFDQGEMKIYYSTSAAMEGKLTKEALYELTRVEGSPVIIEEPFGQGGPDMLQYSLPGIIVMAFFSLAFFGTATPTIQLRTAGVLRLIGLTQVSKLIFILSQLAARFLIAAIQLSILLVLAGMNNMLPMENLLPILLVSLLGLFMLFALGYWVGGVANSIEAVSGVAGGLFGPLLILTGLFMPLKMFPDWLQTISLAIPLTHFGELLRYYMIDEALSVPIVMSYLILVVTMLLLGFFAVRTFRWDQLK